MASDVVVFRDQVLLRFHPNISEQDKIKEPSVVSEDLSLNEIQGGLNRTLFLNLVIVPIAELIVIIPLSVILRRTLSGLP